MTWFYAINGQKNGPVTDSRLDELLASGQINPNTLVWKEGMANWQSLGTVRAINPQLIPQNTVCSECGRVFPPEDLIQLNRSWVCAQCKPVMLQKLSEGVASASATGGLWRMKKLLVTRSETPFPDRCVKCNASAGGFKLKRVLYWQHPAYYLLLLVNLLVLLIVVMLVRKKAILHVGLCPIHQSQRLKAIAIGWIGGVGGLAAALIGGFVFKSGWTALAGTVAFLVCAIYGGLRAPMIAAAKITTESVKIRGVHRDFLAGLPEWPGL